MQRNSVANRTCGSIEFLCGSYCHGPAVNQDAKVKPLQHSSDASEEPKFCSNNMSMDFLSLRKLRRRAEGYEVTYRGWLLDLPPSWSTSCHTKLASNHLFQGRYWHRWVGEERAAGKIKRGFFFVASRGRSSWIFNRQIRLLIDPTTIVMNRTIELLLRTALRKGHKTEILMDDEDTFICTMVNDVLMRHMWHDRDPITSQPHRHQESIRIQNCERKKHSHKFIEKIHYKHSPQVTANPSTIQHAFCVPSPVLCHLGCSLCACPACRQDNFSARDDVPTRCYWNNRGWHHDSSSCPCV